MIKKPFGDEGGGASITTISRETTITGTLDVKGPLIVDGVIKGKILCNDSVTVGPNGNVEAEIEADTAIIAGRMKGNINSTGKIELQAKCEMEGDLRTKSLIIEQGAVFCGACNMKEGRSNLGFLPPEEKKPAAEMATAGASKEKKIFGL